MATDLLKFVAAQGGTVPSPISGRLHADPAGVFRHDDGTIFQWRGFTDFLLYQRYLRGENIAPLLQERVDIGANLVRVLGMVTSFSHFWPQEHADYYEQLAPFAAGVAAYGLRLEFVVFADAEIIMPNEQDEQWHLEEVVNRFHDSPNVVCEVANEPFNGNLPGGDRRAATMGRSVMNRNVLIASGAYTDWPPLRPCDYGTTHPDRGDEWPRKAKDTKDLHDETFVPWVSDEPTGAADVDQPGRRSNVPSDFAYFGATAALEGAGATFHSDCGINSVPLTPRQRECAVAFFEAMRWVPAEAPTWPYQRGDENVCSPGVGNMPICHDDARELRSFCKGGQLYEWCVQIRTTRDHVTPRDGWRVKNEPQRGLVELER